MQQLNDPWFGYMHTHTHSHIHYKPFLLTITYVIDTNLLSCASLNLSG